MKHNIDDILRHLEDAKDRLLQAKSTSIYEFILLEIKLWMEEFEQTVTASDLKIKKYATAYNDIFGPQGGISDYDRICNSLDECALDDLPF